LQDKQFSQACENNKSFILEALQKHFSKTRCALEIGSGTGQHAIYFAEHLAHLQWHCSDQIEYHNGINAWIDEFPRVNLHRPIALKFPFDSLPSIKFDGVFTANTAHIMLKEQVISMMQKVSNGLDKNGVFCQYGPFTIKGEFSSQSNIDFHQHLLAEGCGGYRGIEELQDWAPKLKLVDILPMPANNLMLVWLKS
jgi:hypothetical protein